MKMRFTGNDSKPDKPSNLPEFELGHISMFMKCCTPVGFIEMALGFRPFILGDPMILYLELSHFQAFPLSSPGSPL